MNKCSKCGRSPAEPVRPDGYRIQTLCHSCCSTIVEALDIKKRGLSKW